jgi:hypothetical protein
MKALPFLLLPLAAMAAEPAAPAVELEPVDRDPAWRFSAGFRAAPGVKTSAAVDARAAAAAAGAVLRPSGHGGSSSSGAGSSTSVKTENLGFTTEGTTEADALEAAAFSPDRTRWDFDNGYIDLDDGAEPLREGETQNWHFDSADDFVDGAVRARTPFETTTTTRTRTTKTETTGSSSTKSSVSLREEWGENLRGSSDETAYGFELRLDRTVWEDADWGVDIGVGWAWYGDVDAYSVRGRAYSAVATERRTTTTAPSGSRVTTTETTTEKTESGTVVTSLSQPEFTDPDDYVNADGSIGGAVEDVNAVDSDRTDPMPVLTVTEDCFSTSVERNPTETSSSSKTSVSESGAVGSARTTSSSRTTRRTVDVRSEGTLSLQELRVGVSPFWKASPVLTLRAGAGLLAVYSELETETVLSVDGAPARTIRADDDDWTFGGYAGAALDLAATDALTISFGAEARFPHKRLHFDDGVVSGSVGLAEWSAFASVGWRF